MASISHQGGRVPPLTWRKPGYFWGPLAFALGLGAPALVLSAEGGFAQMAIVTAGVGMLTSLLSLAVAAAMGRQPRSRREVLGHVLWLGALSALTAPIAFQILVNALTPGGAGLSLLLPFALWPLALMIGLPLSLFGGLVLGYVAFTPAPSPEEDFYLRELPDTPAGGQQTHL
ncbi:MAG: hypothetical protein AB7L65_07095 [Hyphomonadaceae bacterium]